jgi:hypothetical protein
MSRLVCRVSDAVKTLGIFPQRKRSKMALSARLFERMLRCGFA